MQISYLDLTTRHHTVLVYTTPEIQEYLKLSYLYHSQRMCMKVHPSSSLIDEIDMCAV